MKWIKATPKDFDGRLSHKFFRDTKTKENLSAGAAFSFFKRDCIDLVEILDESVPPVQSDSDLDDIISKYVGNPSRLLRRDVEKTAIEYASLKTKELREALEEMESEGYDPYDNEHHLTVQRWLKIATKALNNNQ